MPEARDALNLSHSIPFNVFFWSDFPEVRDAADSFLAELPTAAALRARHDRERLKQHLKVVLMNLCYAHYSDPSLWVGYSRSKDQYAVGSRLARLHLNYRPMMRVVNGLKALGYIEDVRGFHDSRSGRGFSSRMRATSRLIEKLQGEHRFTPAMIQMQPPYEHEDLVVLKNSAKEEIPYTDTPEIAQLREDIKAYNRLLWGTYIDIDMNLSDAWIEREDGTPVPEPINLANKQVRAIFNDSSFDLGGRLYGAWWQNCKSRNRQCIIINGENVLELDYKALHPRLLYAMQGLGVQADPYDVSLLPDPDHPKARNVMKLFFMLMINCSSFTEAVQAYRQEVCDNPEDYPPKMGLTELYELDQGYTRLHAPIKNMFYTGIGKTLQNIDSKITMKIVNHMTAQSIPILTVHDSYVCTPNVAEQVQEQMNRAFREYFAIRGNSTVEDIQPKVKRIEYQVRDFGEDEIGNREELAEMLETRQQGRTDPYTRRQQVWRETGNPNIFLDTRRLT